LFKLAERKTVNENTIVSVGDIKIGNGKLVIIAGPCAVESEEQLSETALAVKKSGAQILRGSAFKPRTSPYSFQGLGLKGLKLLKKISTELEMPVETEVMDTRDVKSVCKHVDMIRIGSRNMQNFDLLKEVGKIEKPILLKNGISSTIEEFLMSAEYILSEGNPNVILCERGIRTHETATRFTLDLSAVPVIKKQSHLPVIVDPSHAAGTRELVGPLAKAAVAINCDGLIIEVHNNPEKALCDAKQQLTPEEFSQLMQEIKAIERTMQEINKGVQK